MKTDFYGLLWILFVILTLVFLFCFSGCALLQKKPVVQPIPQTGQELLIDKIQKSNVPVWLCIFIVAGGAVALFNGAIKLGFSTMIFGSTSLALGLATSRFGFWIAMCGLVGTVATILYSILIKNTALKEIIKGIEIFKKTYADPKNIVNTKLAINSVQESTQATDTTKKVVQDVKAKMKIKGEI